MIHRITIWKVDFLSPNDLDDVARAHCLWVQQLHCNSKTFGRSTPEIRQSVHRCAVLRDNVQFFHPLACLSTKHLVCSMRESEWVAGGLVNRCQRKHTWPSVCAADVCARNYCTFSLWKSLLVCCTCSWSRIGVLHSRNSHVSARLCERDSERDSCNLSSDICKHYTCCTRDGSML